MKIILSSIVLLAVVPGLQAQQLASGPHWPASAVGEVPIQHRNVLDQKVSITMKNVGLHTVLDELAKKSGVPVLYSRDVVPVERKVSIQAEGITLQQALQQVLQGTDTEARAASGNRIIIARSSVKTAAEGIIAGKVVNAKTKRPVSGATVVVGPSGRSVTADADGTFRINVSPGERSLTIRAVGFSKQVRTVTVVEGETVRVEIALEQNASVLNEVVVTGTVVATERKAITTPITVITAEEIERRGITSIEEFFRGQVPGVIAIDEGVQRFAGNVMNGGEDVLGAMQTSQIYSRGNTSIDTPEPNPLKTYVDGVEISDPSYLGTIDPQSIERIEIITGPQAATIYGSGALARVMQIFTKRGSGSESLEFTLRMRYGVLQSNLSNGKTPRHNHTFGLTGGIGPALSYAGNISYGYTGQWLPGLFSRSYGASIGATHSRGQFRINGNVALTNGANGTSGWNNIASSIIDWVSGASGEFTLHNRAYYNSRRTSKSSSKTISLSVDYRPHPMWQLNAVAGHSRTEFSLNPQSPVFSTPFDSLYRTSRSNSSRNTFNYNMTWQPALSGVFTPVVTVGVNGSSGEQLRVYGCLASPAAAGYVECRSRGMSITQPLSERSWGGFTSLRGGFFEQLYLTFGLRAERNPRYGEAHKIDWTPTNGISYNIEVANLTVKLLGSYGQATRAPLPEYRDEQYSSFYLYNPSHWLSVAANPELTPERSRGPQGGIELYYGNTATLTVNRYQQTIDDLIQRQYIDSIPYVRLDTYREGYLFTSQWQNVGKIKQHGWETTGSVNLGAFRVQGTHSWNDSRIEYHNRRPDYKGRTFYGVPSHTGSFQLGYAKAKTSLQVISNWIGAFYVERSNNVSGPFNPGRFRIRMYTDYARVPRGAYERKPGYIKTNVALSQRINSSVALTLHVTNLGNSYESDGRAFSPSLGRQTQLGFSWKFAPR